MTTPRDANVFQLACFSIRLLSARPRRAQYRTAAMARSASRWCAWNDWL